MMHFVYTYHKYIDILLVIFTGIQTIQHMMFEKVGCNIPPLVNSTAGGNTTTTFSNLSNDTTITTNSKLLHMSVVISNTTLSFQDNTDNYISNIKPFEYAILVFVPICFLIMVGCMVKLYSLFRWNQYKNHTLSSADDNTRLRTTLLAWSILTGLLKLDFFFLFSYAVQLIPSQLMEYTIPSYESILVFFFSLLAFFLAIQGARTENSKLMWLFSFVLLGSIGYFGYRLFTFGIPRDVTNDPYIVNVVVIHSSLGQIVY